MGMSDSSLAPGLRWLCNEISLHGGQRLEIDLFASSASLAPSRGAEKTPEPKRHEHQDVPDQEAKHTKPPDERVQEAKGLRKGMVSNA